MSLHYKDLSVCLLCPQTYQIFSYHLDRSLSPPTYHSSDKHHYCSERLKSLEFLRLEFSSYPHISASQASAPNKGLSAERTAPAPPCRNYSPQGGELNEHTQLPQLCSQTRSWG